MPGPRPDMLFIITGRHAGHGRFREGEPAPSLPVFEEFCARGLRFDRACSARPVRPPAGAGVAGGMRLLLRSLNPAPGG